MEKDILTKRGDPKNGFTSLEAAKKKGDVEDEYGVYRKNPNWKPAEIVPDPDKESGFMVVIERIAK